MFPFFSFFSFFILPLCLGGLVDANVGCFVAFRIWVLVETNYKFLQELGICLFLFAKKR